MLINLVNKFLFTIFVNINNNNNMSKHFKLTDETIIHDGITLYRIEATIDSRHAKKGDKGGFVETIDNLSDEAWVGDNARVYGNCNL